MRAYFIVIIIIAILGLGVSLTLIPEHKEIALMRFKDAEFKIARDEYESQLESGDWSINVVVPLAKLYLQYGKVDDAANLMEQFVKRKPDNIDARRLLGQYFQYAQRPDDYLRNLQETSELDPSEGVLRELSAVYNFGAKFDQQIKVLKQLIERYPRNAKDFSDLASLQASREDFAGAIVTLTAMERHHQAEISADIIELFISLMLDEGQTQKAFNKASAWLSGHGNPPNTAARLANQFNFKGSPAAGLKLLRPLSDIADDHPALLAELTRLQSELGEEDEAYRRLASLYNDGRLPQVATDILIGLALQRKERELAMTIADQAELPLLPTWLLVALIEVAVAESKPDFATRMIDRLGSTFLANRPALAAEVFLSSGDVPGAKRWIDKAKNISDPSISERTSLARVYFRIGDHGDAIRLLKQVSIDEDVGEAILGDLVQIYLKSGAAKEGAEFFEQLREQKSHPAIETGWAVLAAYDGRDDKVLEWLDAADEKALHPAFLVDIYYIAGDRLADKLRLAAAERLLGARDTPDNRQLYLQAIVDLRMPKRFLSPVRDVIEATSSAEETHRLVQKLEEIDLHDAAGWMRSRIKKEASPGQKPSDHFATLRRLRAASPPDRVQLAGYVAIAEMTLGLETSIGEAMRQTWRDKLAGGSLSEKERGEAVSQLISLGDVDSAIDDLEKLAQEAQGIWVPTFIDVARKAKMMERLKAFLMARIKQPGIAQSAKDEMVYALLEIHGPRAALPFLRDNAFQRGGGWVFAYDDALVKTGETKTLHEFWRKIAFDRKRPEDQRQYMAFQLLKDGQTDVATNAFKDIALVAPPNSAAVDQLLFLWGPRSKKDGVNWIYNRARASKGKFRESWFKILLNTAGPDHVLKLASELSSDEIDHGVGRIQLDALLMKKNKVEFKRLLKRLSSAKVSPEKVREYADLAFQEDLLPLARELYERTMKSGKMDRSAYRRLALSKYYLGDNEAAFDALTEFLSQYEGDADTHQFIGELFSKQGQQESAQYHFEQALEFALKKPDTSFASRRRVAWLMARTNRIIEATEIYEKLIVEHADVLDLRAEYGAFLLANNRISRAEQILEKEMTSKVE